MCCAACLMHRKGSGLGKVKEGEGRRKKEGEGRRKKEGEGRRRKEGEGRKEDVST